MSSRQFECQHPAKGLPRKKRVTDLPQGAKPVAAWFKSLSGEWLLMNVVDSENHPAWMDHAYTFTQATELKVV